MSAKAILIKTLQTSARCKLSVTVTSKPITNAAVAASITTKRTFVLYNGFRTDKFRMMNKEGVLSQSTTTSEQDLIKLNDSTNNESSNDYYIPKSRQTVYSAQGDEIETASPVNRMH